MDENNETLAISVPSERIENRIFLIRGKKVMFDRDLAELYGVETRALNQAVKRNGERFPEDFVFILTLSEAHSLRSQIVISNVGRGGARYLPMVFTEQGIAMLSSVLKSPRAILVNIQIIRTFTKLREMIISNAELRKRLDELEKRYDERFQSVFRVMHRLLDENTDEGKEIGFKT